MALICLLSGPITARSQAAHAIQQAGARILEDVEHGWGHPDRTDGSSDPLVGWLTAVDGSDDPNRSADVAAAFGWALRAHWAEPPTPKPDPYVELLGRFERMEAALRAKGISL